MVLRERSAIVLAASFAVGGYIAFSPYLFLHTVMVFVFSWLFSLNYFVVLASSNLINNPWSMVFVYSSGYFVGEWILGTLCGIDTASCNPYWVQWFNELLHSKTGLQGIAFWSFMVGGNLLGLLVAGMLYPIMKPIFTRLVKQIHN